MSEAKETQNQNQPILGLTAETLKTLIEEIRKPIITDKEKREIESAQQARKDTAELHKSEVAKKKQNQKLCTHTHKRGDTHAVYIENGNFIICQKCQDVIRPDDRPDLFNRLFQSCQTELFG